MYHIFSIGGGKQSNVVKNELASKILKYFELISGAVTMPQVR